jgi:hypothetical protein
MVPRGGVQQVRKIKALQREGRKRKRPSSLARVTDAFSARLGRTASQTFICAILPDHLGPILLQKSVEACVEW